MPPATRARKRGQAKASEPVQTVTSKRQRTRNSHVSTELTWDAWCQVCEALGEQNRRDLYRLCLVSKGFNSLATRFLYRSIVLSPAAGASIQTPESLLRRLLDDSNIKLRDHVQELTISNTASSAEIGDFEKKHYLAQLVEHLPNLRRVRIACPLLLTEQFITSINKHPRKPDLQLLGEQGSHPPPSQPLPCVSNLEACVSRHWPYARWNDRGHRPRPRPLNFQDLFFSCPNLNSCSLTIRGYTPPPKTPAYSYFDEPEMTGEETFPPIQNLSLNGRYIGDSEWPHWRDRFPWSILSSLSIGPQSEHACRTLDQMAGFARSLKTLKLEVFYEKRNQNCESLKWFLLSFDTLVDLELQNYPCPVQAIAQHTQLVRLCLHSTESWNYQTQRNVLSKEDLEHLDAHCPHLEYLELDIERQNDDWPWDILTTLATLFDNLRKLTFHFRLGNTRNPQMPVLNYHSAQDIGNVFYKSRQAAFERYPGIHTSEKARAEPSSTSASARFLNKLERLTLKTGFEKSLRRYPDPYPRRAAWAELHTVTFELRPPKTAIEKPEFTHLQRQELEAIPDRRALDPAYYKKLKKMVDVAVEGP